MQQNQRTNNDRNDQQNNLGNEQNNESLNTASGLRNELQNQQDSAGSGRSYDYGTEGSSEEDQNQQLGRNSNQQNISNPLSTPQTDSSDALPGTHSNSRAGTGSGLTTKQNITGSDFDGQNRS
jgi:hypothetical protein